MKKRRNKKQKDMIEIKNVSVVFKRTTEKMTSLKEYFINSLKKKIKKEKFVALEDINITIKKGEIVGLLGLNGAGKSTLLKVISGIIKPTSGEVKLNGKMAPLIELGAGFDPELTGRENIFLNGSLLGFSKKELKDKIEDIIDFSELKEFIDIPLKNYSSGMYARLGFSIATIYEPEILIIDEVLSVGDFHFQEKSLNKIMEMIEKGTTVLFVSHDIEQVEKLCKKAIWLEKGKVKVIGDAKKICKEYSKS
ncbi:ABC transporter ATP-binding protein [Leptotrichia sp.]|uniref:ABC transporter ATP-binding protein n=1 Tax=Leptotrichia sp. TaxID=104608 RepID=UPI0025C0D91B|nr:ABC transporter ATP-binding protein [Leptotrichia sp.]